MSEPRQTISNGRKVVSDMRDLSAMLAASARELEQFVSAIERLVSLFAPGGEAPSATPFAEGEDRRSSDPPPPRRKRSRSSPELALLARQRWFSLPSERRTVPEGKRIAEDLGMTYTNFHHLIARTLKSDYDSFLKRQEPKSSGSESTSSTNSPTASVS